MRCLRPMLVLTLCLWPMTCAAWAQGTFPLKYVEAGDDDHLIAFGMRISGGVAILPPSPARLAKVAERMPTQPSQPAPASVPPRPPAFVKETGPGRALQLRAAPKGLSDKALSYILSLGNHHFCAIVDPVSLPRLYLGPAEEGDLTTAAPIVGTIREGQCVFSSVAVPPAQGVDGAPLKMRFTTLEGGQLLAMCPAGYFAGEVTLGGQAYRVALVDANCNGGVSDVSGLSADGKEWRGEDRLAIDLNQDGAFTGNEAIEVQWLCKTLRVRDVYYSVQVAPDGSSIRLDEVKPKTGTLDCGGADVSLVLVSEMGMHALGGGDGKWVLPEGEYITRSLTLAKSDRAGEKWMLSDLSAFGMLRRVAVRAGETVTLKVGPPLTLKVEAVSGGPAQVLASLCLEGAAGERYSVGLEKAGGASLPAPKVKVLDESGKVLAEGNSEYG
jgi:hypothetical protein